jgi:hypothetical protein
MKRVSDDDIVRLVCEDTEVEGEFCDGSEHEVYAKFMGGVEDTEVEGEFSDECEHEVYAKFMGGVDRADQYCGCYGFTRKSYRWRKKLFFWLMEVAVMSSYTSVTH